MTGVTFAAGDQFGARALHDGTLQVFRNGVSLGTVSIASSPYAGLGGRIGLSVANATLSRFNLFGGGAVDVPVSVIDSTALARAGGIALSGAYPNPTAGEIRLRLELPAECEVGFRVVDLQGRTIWNESARRHAAGRWTLGWNGRTASGAAPSGVYFASVRAGTREFVRRIAIVR